MWAEEYSQAQEFSLLNLLFFRNSDRVDNNTYLQFTVTNGTFSNNLPYAYFDINASYKYLFFYNPETETTSTATAYACNTSRYYSYKNPRFTQSYEITSNTIAVENYATAMNTYVVYANTSEFGKKDFFLVSNYEIVLDPTINPDLPESGDTGGGTTTPSGDTGTTTPDYTEQLGNIQTGITNIENKIPTSGEVQEVISGTLNEAFREGSGEVTSEKIDNLQEDVNEIMGDIVPANNFIGMFNQIISAFSEALLGQGEETIEFEHRGENYVISSNQVNLPIAEIKGFLSVFFNVAIVMAMALTISWIIRRMEEGDLISVLHMGDADMYFYEDLNLF